MLNQHAKLLFLASYPKSGNTWVRLFLNVLLRGNPEVDINQIDTDIDIASRSLLNEAIGLNSAHFPASDLLEHRSRAYQHWAQAQTTTDLLLCKAHECCIQKDRPLFPPAIARGVVYIMRNPLDIAASLANHHRISIHDAVNLLCDPNYILAGKGDNRNPMIAQRVGTWGEHVSSWTDLHQNNILVVKYENLLHNPLHEFCRLVSYLELPYTTQQVGVAIQKVNFTILREQESRSGFNLTPQVKQFFRSGVSGGWRHELNNAQVDQLMEAHRHALLKWGYLDERGNVLDAY